MKTNRFSKILERDFDILLAEELAANVRFRTRLFSKAFGTPLTQPKRVLVWHSLSQAGLGESDLVCVATFAGGLRSPALPQDEPRQNRPSAERVRQSAPDSSARIEPPLQIQVRDPCCRKVGDHSVRSTRRRQDPALLASEIKNPEWSQEGCETRRIGICPEIGLAALIGKTPAELESGLHLKIR